MGEVEEAYVEKEGMEEKSGELTILNSLFYNQQV